MMSESDSDSESGIMRVASLTPPPTEWEFVPETIKYNLKVKLQPSDKKKKILVYELKKGVALPYSPDIKGLNSLVLKKLSYFGLTCRRQTEDHLCKISGSND